MSDFTTAYPRSRKVLVDGLKGVRVPMREIALSGDEPSLRVYDTSGPQDCDVATGLPKLREPWVASIREEELTCVVVSLILFALDV
jgi:phosphomethylpyrimidine synthase